MQLFEATGIAVVICANFTRAFADQHPEDFARDVLHEKIGVKEVYVGYDYTFGKGGEGAQGDGRRGLISMVLDISRHGSEALSE